MKEKESVKLPEPLERAWKEVMVCATLIRQGQARIMCVTRKDGSICRYTKPGQ